MKSSLSKWALLPLLLLAACGQQRMKLPPYVERILPPAPPIMAERVEPPVKGEIPAETPTIKVALLVPLSGDSLAVGNAMLDASTMALSDSYLVVPSDQIHSKIIMLPKDTGSTAADAAKAAQQAIDQGATFVLGPLFSQSVKTVGPVAKDKNIPVLSFSNTREAAGEGIYVYGFLPEQQVHRIAEYAYLHNLQRIAVLAPNDPYGEKVKDTLIEDYRQKGGIVSPAELYAPSPANIEAAVSRLAAAYNNLTEERRFQALFIADGGYQLKNIIEALKKNRIDLKKVKLIGTGQWDDPDISKIPEMTGAWFPSAPHEPYAKFERHFVATYGYKPVRLASLAYDAVSLIATLSMPMPGTPITNDMLTNPAGFIGPANGLYRLRPDGTSERALAIMEITPSGVRVIDIAPHEFPSSSEAQQ